METIWRLLILILCTVLVSAYRKLLCEGEIGGIKCGKDQTIRIIRGSYGRSDSATCWTGAADTELCVGESALLTLYEKCSGQQYCDLSASDSVFGYACMNSSSYLDVEYFCEGTVTVCEGNITTVRCPDQGRVSIINANYGRRNTHTCPYGPVRSIHCFSKVTVDVLLHECEGRRTCRFDASSAVFGDPCPPTYKYLEANYRCNK